MNTNRKPKRQPHWICATTGACLCSGSDEQCNCVRKTTYVQPVLPGRAVRVDMCSACNAGMVCIDFATGELLEAGDPVHVEVLVKGRPWPPPACIETAPVPYGQSALGGVGLADRDRETEPAPPPVFCGECGAELEPVRAVADGEPTLRGHHPCPKHPDARIRPGPPPIHLPGPGMQGRH